MIRPPMQATLSNHRYQKHPHERLLDKKQREEIFAQCLTRDQFLFEFGIHLYQKIYQLVSSDMPNSNNEPAYLSELKESVLYHDVFAHTNSSYFTPQMSHGSVGQGMFLFFKQKLPHENSHYFDVLFTCIFNAIYQYKEKGLMKVLEIDFGYPQLSEIDSLKPYRQKSTIVPPFVDELNLPLEEFKARFEGRSEPLDKARGECCYSLSSCWYTKRAEDLAAPCTTGLSSNGYMVFKFCAVKLKLNVSELIQLRNALVAYLVAARDHTLIEVLDGVNIALNDLNSEYGMDISLVKIPLDTELDYANAVNIVFPSAKFEDKTTIQKSLIPLIQSLDLPLWCKKIMKEHIYQFFLRNNEIMFLKKEQEIFEILKESLLSILHKISNLSPYSIRIKCEEDIKYVTSIRTLVDVCCVGILASPDSQLFLEYNKKLNENGSPLLHFAWIEAKNN